MIDLLLIGIFFAWTWKVWRFMFGLIYDAIRHPVDYKGSGPDMHEPWQDNFSGG